MQMDIVNFYRNNRDILEKIESEENKESVYQYYEQQLLEINDELKERGLILFEDDVGFSRNYNTISCIGSSLNSLSFEITYLNMQLEFEIFKSTECTNLWLRRFTGSRMKKSDSISLQESLTQEKIHFIEQNDHYDIQLLGEGEAISTKEFAIKAAPIIRKILEIHNIQTIAA